MKDTFLRINDLRVEYTSGGQIVKAVNGVNLELGKGETLGLVGETGAGKTTIAKAILRILPDPPAKIRSGEVWLNGENLLTLPEKQMLKIRGGKIAMIFQDPMTALNPTMSIGSQITEVILLHNDIPTAQAKQRTIEMLELVGSPVYRVSASVFRRHEAAGGHCHGVGLQSGASPGRRAYDRTGCYDSGTGSGNDDEPEAETEYLHDSDYT